MRFATLLLLLTDVGGAQEMQRMTTWERAWVASSAAFVGAQVADVATSYGNVGRETNPLFGDTFTAKDAAVKLGVTGAIIGAAKSPHYVIPDKCVACGACVEACRFDAVIKE